MRALIIIASNGFQDYEFQEPYEALLGAGHQVMIASSRPGVCVGKLGIHTATATLALKDVKPDEFDQIVLVGGPGAIQEFANNDTYGSIAKQAKRLAAICITPTLIAPYGVLEGKKCTGWDDGNGTQIAIIKKYGGIFQHQNVVIDGNLITANGPHAAKEFAKAIVENLQPKEA